MRLQILRKAAEYTSSKEDLKIIYISYIRSILEQSAVIWQASITKENRIDLKRVQKNATRIIFKNKYKDYQESLTDLNLQTLEERRNKLSFKFAKNFIKNKKN